MDKEIDFKWSGKTKQICRVNGVIVGFLEDASNGRTPSWRWDSRFMKSWKPHFDSALEGRKHIEHLFTTWLENVYK